MRPVAAAILAPPDCRAQPLIAAAGEDGAVRRRDGLHAQRAARALARRFDNALRPAGMTNGQFSLMMALNRPGAAGMGSVATLLAMDRTSLTAMLKPLARRGWVEVSVDEEGRRGRRLELTAAGRAALARAVPIWEREHAAVEAGVGSADALRAGLNALAFREG